MMHNDTTIGICQYVKYVDEVFIHLNAIEVGGASDAVCPKVREQQPIAHSQLRQQHIPITYI